MSRDVVVLSAVRSAIGAFGGSLSGLEPSELGGMVMKEAVTRSGVDPNQINYVTVGNCIPTDSRYAYVARVASIQAGLPMESVAMAVNRLCSSGLQAIVSSAQNIMLGDCDYSVGGGVEVMSRSGYMSTAMRNGARMGDTSMIDLMVSVLSDPFGVGHMGITAENLATKWNISREEQDAVAVESQRRAAAAIQEGRFKSQIVPITIKSRKGDVVFDTDEHVKANTTLESLAKMRPAFKKDGGRQQYVASENWGWICKSLRGNVDTCARLSVAGGVPSQTRRASRRRCKNIGDGSSSNVICCSWRGIRLTSTGRGGIDRSNPVGQCHRSNIPVDISLSLSHARTVSRALHVVTVLRQRDGGQNTDDRHDDHQFDEGKTLLHLAHGKVLSEKQRKTRCATRTQEACQPSQLPITGDRAPAAIGF